MRNTVIKFSDGYTGSAAVEDLAIAGSNTTLEIDTIANLPSAVTILPVGVRFTVADMSPLVTYTITAANSNEQQTITLDTPSSGNYTLTWDGEGPTASIAYNASAAAVQAALELLTNITAGDIVVTGTPGVSYVVEFKGTYLATDVALMTIQDVDLVDAGAEAVTLLHDGATTWELTFTPALDGANLPVNGKAITFLPQQIDIKVGDGNVTYTESNEYEYDLDRGVLDTVRAGDEVPMDVSLDFVYEYITTGTGEAISPMDVLKNIGGASGWVSSSADACEPYAIDVEVVHTPICTTQAIETTVFSDFRSDSREVDLGEAAVAVSGRCNVTQPTVSRTAQ